MKNILNEEQLSIVVNKMDAYKRLEDVCFDNIYNHLRQINDHYQSKNTNRLDSKFLEINRKFKTINQIHNNNIFVVRKNIENYVSTKTKVENIFNKIETDII